MLLMHTCSPYALLSAWLEVRMDSKSVSLVVVGVVVSCLVSMAAWLFLPRIRVQVSPYRDPLPAWGEWDDPYPETVTLQLDPSDALADVPLRLRVTGLSPGQRVGLRLWARDRNEGRWEFSGIWQADEQGRLDVPAASPLEVSAPIPEGDGLLGALRPVGAGRDSLFRPSEPYRVYAQVEAAGRVLARAEGLRRHRAAGVVCLGLEGEQVGIYCRPEGDGPFPAILVLGGSEGGVPEDDAAWWASHGVAALGLAYFGAGDLPSALVEIPLEYFLSAVDALRARPEVDADRVLLFGASRGSEAALLTAAHDPKVAGVIVVAPSSIVWSGLDFSRGPRSAWTYGGEPLPFLSVPLSVDMLRMALGLPVSLRDEFERGAKGATPDVFIPVERIQGPLLLIAGTDDQLWPSDRLVAQIEERLAAHDFPWPVETVLVDGAGHAFLPYEEPQPSLVENLVLGGTPEANFRLSRRARRAMLEFVQNLGP